MGSTTAAKEKRRGGMVHRGIEVRRGGREKGRTVAPGTEGNRGEGEELRGEWEERRTTVDGILGVRDERVEMKGYI